MTSKDLLKSIAQYFRTIFSLSQDTDIVGTTENIKKGIYFRGVNLWTLVFSIFVASIGLNVNSTAVIIGAMLISPLMGPIMGIGLSLGTNDFETLKRSGRNLFLAVIISLATSTLYFLLSPLSEAQSELLARTQPTIYDVLIAFFGGAAGIVAGSRMGERGNAIPGVAIATALMPPLCTAGYGLATMQPQFFFGAFYLFFINSVFIAFSTLVFVRYLHFPVVNYVDAAKAKRSQYIIMTVILLTAVPSIYFAYNIVGDVILRQKASRFLREQFSFDSTDLIKHDIQFGKDSSRIEVTLVGQPLSMAQIQQLQKELPKYGMNKARLVVFQNDIDASKFEQHFSDMNRNLRQEMFETLYKRNEEKLQDKNAKIRLLEQELFKCQGRDVPVRQLLQEVRLFSPNVRAISFGQMSSASMAAPDSLMIRPMALINWTRRPSASEAKKLTEFLQTRTGAKELQVFNE